MKKNILLSLSLLVFALVSCKKSLEINDLNTLSLSIDGTVAIPAGGQDLAVTVTTDLTEWSYLGSADWIKVSKEDKRLNISVKANTSSVKRSLPIVVMAGKVSQSFVIEQEGSAVTVSDSKDITVAQWNDQISILVQSDDPNWEVICSASSWLSYTSNPRKREISVILSENKDINERIATFYIRTKSGKGNYEIKLTQSGAMFYLLPYPGFSETEREVKAFEDARRSLLIGKPSGGTSPLFGGNSNVWTFETQSKAFGQIQYIIEPDERQYRSAILWANDPMFFRRDREIDNTIEFLQKNGFVLRRNTTYYNEDLECSAMLGMTNEGSFIMYTFEPKQPAPAKTFEKFPWGILEEPRWRNYNREDVEEWEKNHGGKFVLEEYDDDEIALAYASDELDGMIRIYKISDVDEVRPLVDVIHVFSNTSRIYYKVKGAIMLTREFAELARQEGFVFRSYIDSTIFMYENTQRSIYLGVYKFLEEDPEDPSIYLEYAKMEFLPIYNNDKPDLSYIEHAPLKRKSESDPLISKVLSRINQIK